MRNQYPTLLLAHHKFWNITKIGIPNKILQTYILSFMFQANDVEQLNDGNQIKHLYISELILKSFELFILAKFTKFAK